VMGNIAAGLEADIAAVLENNKNRARWLKCAGYQRFEGSV
jgi:hypothetical protein